MNARPFIKEHPVFSYCLLTILWSFSWWSLILTVVPVGGLFKPPLHPLALLYMILGGIGPSLSGLLLARLVGGRGSAGELLARVRQWRAGWMWLALLIPWAVNGVAVGFQALAGVAVDGSRFIGMLGPGIFLGLYAGMAEEFGWRGFLLPHLQQRYSPLVSALLVGLVWGGIWHGYADYIGLGDQGWRALPLILLLGPLLLTADSILLTWIYNNTRGSLLLCALFHMGISATGLIFSPEHLPYESQLFWTVFTVLLWWVAAATVVLPGRWHLARGRRQYQRA